MKSASPKCTTCDSTTCFINQFVNAKWKKKIEKEKITTTYKKGQLIFSEGNPVHGIYFIYKGIVKLFNTGPKNRNQIVRIAGDGKIFGHRGFGDKMIYPINASTIDESTICFISAEIFKSALNNNPPLVYNLMMFYAEELKRAEYKFRIISQMTVKQGLADTLFTLRNKFGETEKEGQQVININLSRQELADITGASLEEIIRTLSQLKKEGAIDLVGKNISIKDEKKLQTIIKDFSSIVLA